MHKQATENKAAKPADVHTDANGREIRKATLEDPARPGYLRRGATLDQGEFFAACLFGLRTPRGDSLALVETSPDPFEVQLEEAPKELRAEVDVATKELQEATELVRKAAEALDKAEGKTRQTMREGNPGQYNRLRAEQEKVHELWLKLREEEQGALVKFNDADHAVKKWCEREQIRRRAEADRKAEEEKRATRDAEAKRERARVLGA